MKREHIVASVVKSAGGHLIGRVRLQKIVYLLDQLGLNSEFDYTYHHYGPFSEQLVSAAEDAKAFNLINEDFKYRPDGMRFSNFELSNAEDSDIVYLDDQLRRHVEYLKNVNSTVLELAATIHWLNNYEKVDDWRVEVIKRKGKKTSNGRLEKSIELLKELNLDAGSIGAS